MASLGVKFENFLEELPSSEDVQQRVNNRYDDLFVKDTDGKLRPYVCAICDEFLLEDGDTYRITLPKLEAAKGILSWSYIEDTRRSREIEEKFSFDVSKTDCSEDLSFLKGMALSPRASVFKKQARNSKWGFSSCQRCHGNISKKDPTLPRNAIINKNYVGCAPQVLLDLNEPELAFLSPVKNYGYCFTHTGGTQKLLKGTCTFMRVKKQGIANSVSILEDIGLTNHVLVLFLGKMTKEQRKRAKERSTIRTEKIIAALHWLVQHNVRWENINVDDVRRGLEQHEPMIIDRSETVESENANLEKQELFTVFYPDGATTPKTGGFEKPGIFKEYVQQMAAEGYAVEFQSNLEKKFTKDSESDILLDACLLQYPYGIGGMEEDRLLHDESITTKSDLLQYFDHVSRLSQNVFQTPMFQLIMYSMVSKLRILKKSRLQLRGKTNAENLANNFDPQDVISCIKKRRMNNYHGGTNVARKYLSSVDACSKALPHTNQAAKDARGNGEAMQHHFGMSSVFLTVTFDDENSLLMQVYAGVEVDDGKTAGLLSDHELSIRAKKRRQIRLEYPGVASMNFEVLFKILTEEVIGWDLKRHKRTDKVGLFGPLYAFSCAIEEQGRKTLHAHMTLWIKGYKDIQNEFFFGTTKKEKRHAKRILSRFHEHMATTALFPDDVNTVRKAFDHECTEEKLRDRQPPAVVCPQSLRILRNRRGHKDTKGTFALCPHCPKVWTYEDMVCEYLKNVEGLRQSPAFDLQGSSSGRRVSTRVKDQLPSARMFGKVMDYQRDMMMDAPIPYACINAGYQHHLSCHVTGCFRCQKKGSKKRNHVCGPTCECRYRLPDLPRGNAEVMISSESVPWYNWAGVKWDQPLCQVLPKRKKYDLFQNVACRAISHSKFSCNSNLSLILDGPIGQYMHKYQEKQNQDEETFEYKEVEKSIRKMNGERIHEDDRKEAMRLMLRGAFAHNKSNVISPSFAAYLTRHTSRFYYSHPFQFCALNDVIRLHKRQEIQARLVYSSDGTTTFFENRALDYFCRSVELEDYCLFDCTQEYASHRVPSKERKNKKQKQNTVFPFRADTGYYRHPSVLTTGPHAGKCSQGLKERDSKVYVRISQWEFPDTAQFQCDIRDAADKDLNSDMEVYAQLVLSLFMPHRSRHDITVSCTEYPYTKKLQEVWKVEKTFIDSGHLERVMVFTEDHTSFLQNVQNCRSNTLRYQIKDDPLSTTTVPYQSPHAEMEEHKEDDDDKLDFTDYELFAQALETSMGSSDTTNENPEFLPAALRNFEFKHIRNKGTQRCGWQSDLAAPIRRTYEVPFVKISHVSAPNNMPQCPTYPAERPRYNVDIIVKLHLRRNQPLRSKALWKTKSISATDATGSIKSVREWAKAAFGSDSRQRRAFELLTAAFLLTFYDEQPEETVDPTLQGNNRAKYRTARLGLMKLRGTKDDKNLVCLLHGPGGSGKSTVINAVIAYARDYCEQLQHPFTNRTIIVTAMSGVAATLLNGETTHSVLGLNRSSVAAEEIAEWNDARLLIIDEISFASEEDFSKMHHNLKVYMQENYRIFGGLNMVFAGDYSQLEPVQRDPIYKGGNESEFFQKAVNCYIELDGKWRFSNDPAWGAMMGRFRDGEPTLEDIQTINNQCSVSAKNPPADLQVASYTNRNRCAINTAIFDKYTETHGSSEYTESHGSSDDNTFLEGTCMIFMNDLTAKNSRTTYIPVVNNAVLKYFYENVTESDVGRANDRSGKFDPCLKLYQDCPVMFTMNEDVSNGQANGSRTFVKGVHMKGGESPFTLKLDNGTTVLGMYASQVKSIEVEHENDDIMPRRFQVKAKTWKFKCKMQTDDIEETNLAMQGTAFPLISNNCTTGHKLQGCTVDAILANDWHYKANWVYVVLSRVKTMNGLYLRQKLSTDLAKYTKPDEMKAMIRKFARTVAATKLTDDEYEELEAINAPVLMLPVASEFLQQESDAAF